MRRVWFALLAAAALAGSAPAQDAAPPKPAAGPFVVLVGVGTFADPAIKPRPTADADARAVYDLLSDPARLPGVAGRVRLLTSTPDAKRGEKPATRENVLAAVHEARAGTGKDDLVVIGYFGSGASALDRTALFTSDTVFKDRAKTAVLGADLDADLRAMQDRKVMLLLDADFKGFDPGKETVAEPNLSDLLKALYNQTDDAAAEQEPPSNKVLFLASVLGQTTPKKGNNGLFAALLAEAAGGAADTEGYEPDGLVTVDELADYLDKQGPDQARKLGTTNGQKEAVPLVIGKGSSHFPVVRNPATYPKVAARLDALAKLEASAAITKEAGEEGRGLLGRMPKLKSRQDLRKLYQGLADGGTPAAEFAAERTRLQEGLKLTADETDRFARVVSKAIEQVRGSYVKEIPAGEWAAMAVRGLFRRLDEPLPDDLAAKLKTPKSIPKGDVLTLLADARGRLGRRDDIPTGGKDVDKAIGGMMFELNMQYRDPHTVYFDAEAITKAESALRGEFRGVGIQIRRDAVRDGLLVASPIKNSPAYRAGIQTGDLITEIRREVGPKGETLSADQPKVISTKGMKTEDALGIILGKPGVPVTLVVERDGADGKPETKEFTIRRGVVETETVLGVKRDGKDDWTYMLDDENKIGYVWLTQFNGNCGELLKRTVTKLQQAGMRAMVLDLRGNPGGRLDQAIKISDLFIDDGVVVSVRYRPGTRDPEVHQDMGFGRFTGFPMAVLVNGGSASASEIVAACLKDHERAVVVGERSFGKGSVQTVQPFQPTGGEIKLTTARYFPPKGENIDKLATTGKETEEWGVRPDPGFEVKLSDEEERDLAVYLRDREIIPRKDKPAKDPEKAFKDRQLDKALDYLRGQLKTTAALPARKAG